MVAALVGATGLATPTAISDDSNYTALLIALLALLIVPPFLDIFIVESGSSLLFMNSLISAVLLSATYAVHHRKTLLLLSCVLLFPTLAGRWAAYAFPDYPWFLVSDGFGFLFFVVIAGVVLSQVLQERRVTIHVVNGSICVYLIIGVAWASLFSLVEGFQPGSFNLPAILIDGGQTASSELHRFRLFLYYSLVTLTTLGYGDVTPITYPARNLAVVEAIIGQLYIAVLIARLVGLSTARTGQD